MKKMIGILSMLLVSACYAGQLKIINVNHGLRFDAALYGSVETIGKNVYAQADISTGWAFHTYGILSLETSIKYRNYSFVTTEHLIASLGGAVRENEGRIGIAVGCQTYRLGGYREIVPSGGVQIQYIRYLTAKISLRIKERITLLTSEEKTLFTATLLGLGVSF
ncbi:MAG TPA: hypothetical protein VHO70_16145 [Chitinispirillaceae bacterium]|nr:hypothetical protein [Chitinispirillaceae bacterium]